MGESTPTPTTLSPEAYARLVCEERIRGANLWFEENVRLWERAAARVKSEDLAEANARYEEQKLELLDHLCSQFSDLMRTSGPELADYIRSLPPAKRATVVMLGEASHRAGKKRSHKAAHPKAQAKSLPIDGLRAVLTKAAEAGGVDVRAMVILADNCFLYGGRIYSVGNAVRLETRIPGRTMQGLITSATMDEIDVTFHDGTLVTLEKGDLAFGRIAIHPAD
jgi:hypothetical protein